MYQGLFPLPVWGYVVVTLLLTHITIIGITLFLHREQTHHALDLHPVVSHFLRFWLWMTTGVVTREWVAIHRKHHAKCETAEDPHSPRVRGLRKVLWQGTELYRAAAADPEIVAKYGKGTPDDWLERNLYAGRSLHGISLMLVINVVLFGPIGLTIWAVQMLWSPFWAAGVINGVGHYWGYRNFNSRDGSVNIVPWGILIGGEELHNNHHAFLNSAKLSSRPWEFDIGWFYIRVLERCGLATVRKYAARPNIDSSPVPLDLDSVQALTVNRAYLFADYRRRVLRPVLRAEIKQVRGDLRGLYKQVGRKLLNGLAARGDCARSSVDEVLARCPTLRSVHEQRKRLEAIWDNYAVSQEWRLQALRDWCAEAEASGVEALRRFTPLLRSYRLANAG
jgi:stearoyl-CoA desaturase (delta-9 desaturase)